MTIDLKPCPFCDGEGKIEREIASFPPRYYPVCKNDKCILSNIREDEDGHVWLTGDTPDEAAIAWNTRPEEERAHRAIERFRLALETERNAGNNLISRLSDWGYKSAGQTPPMEIVKAVGEFEINRIEGQTE